jgi:hypothetical protein
MITSPPPPYATNSIGGLTPEQFRMNRFCDIAAKYEIRPDFCSKLRLLEDYEIILIADDSGSMATRISDIPSTNPLASTSSFAFAPSKTRWLELLEFSNIVVEIASVMDSDGIDIYFLNRPPLLNIHNPLQPEFLTAFSFPPRGSTPLVKTLQSVIASRCRTGTSTDCKKNTLIIIATDGTPDEGVDEFIKTIKFRPPNINISILACTDDDAAVSYMNNIDRIIPGVDVVDDYRSELIEIRKARGSHFPFSYGDYVVKILLGSIDPVMDKLDESNSCCCSVS